jgi:tRNA threonylcarbamoyladenosine biosynthesis protein TsaE
MQLHLPDENRTLELGSLLAGILQQHGPCAVLFQGPLGSGKTTLVRGLVEHYPGGDQAEVNSPSFNLANIYPTSPEIIHLDLYRIQAGEVDEAVEEYLDLPARQILMEWSEHLPEAAYPEHYLLIGLDYQGSARHAVIRAYGAPAEQILAHLRDRCRGRWDHLTFKGSSA